MAELVVAMLLLLLLVGIGVAAALSYRRHSRRAKARSRAALNRLLAEADELAQSAQHPPDDEPPTGSVSGV
jgi:type II secretory pathway pseudopilin PulG